MCYVTHENIHANNTLAFAPSGSRFWAVQTQTANPKNTLLKSLKKLTGFAPPYPALEKEKNLLQSLTHLKKFGKSHPVHIAFKHHF